MIQEALTDARTELAALHARETELENLIAQAETALGEPPTHAATGEAVTMTLHEAIAQLLRENDNEWMTARELADALNQRSLYRKRDGSPVEVNQVHARTNNYRSIFEKDGPNVRLREESLMLTTLGPSLTVFHDDDEGFFEWIDANPEGYFINTERNPKPNYLVLHRPECPHFDRSSKAHWTRDYIKICSLGRPELEEWAEETVKGEVTLCRTCFGR